MSAVVTPHLIYGVEKPYVYGDVVDLIPYAISRNLPGVYVSLVMLEPSVHDHLFMGCAPLHPQVALFITLSYNIFQWIMFTSNCITHYDHNILITTFAIILINKKNNDKFKFKKMFLLQSAIIPLSFLPTSGLFCKDATHMQLPDHYIRLYICSR